MTHHPDKLPAKLLAWFAANPGEELTYADISAKWDVSRKVAHVTVERLKAEGLLDTSHIVRARLAPPQSAPREG